MHVHICMLWPCPIHFDRFIFKKLSKHYPSWIDILPLYHLSWMNMERKIPALYHVSCDMRNILSAASIGCFIIEQIMTNITWTHEQRLNRSRFWDWGLKHMHKLWVTQTVVTAHTHKSWVKATVGGPTGTVWMSPTRLMEVLPHTHTHTLQQNTRQITSKATTGGLQPPRHYLDAQMIDY